MLNETYRAMLNNKSVIRETFMYGRQRAAQIGSENVFDYSLGNPSVPCPPEFTEAMQTLLAQEEPVSLHGYCPSQGDPGFRTAVAEHLTETFGLPYAQKHIFPTTGAAGAIAHAIRAVTQPGDEVLTFAPYFPEYGPYVAGTGAVLLSLIHIFFIAECHDRRGRGHRRGRQRPAVQESGRKEPAPCQRYGLSLIHI